MNDKNLDGIEKPENEWDENDILNGGMSSISNMSNMVSMSSIFTPTIPSIPNINSTEVLSDIKVEKNRSNNR